MQLSGKTRNSSPDQFDLDCEAYRAIHGSHTLGTYYRRSTGKLYVLKCQNAEEAILIEVFGGQNILVTTIELSSEFSVWIQDECVFLFGTETQQESARYLWDCVTEAMSQVMHARQVPVVV